MVRVRHAHSALLALCLLLAVTALLPSAAVSPSARSVPVSRTRIFLGDSRTVGMYFAIHGAYAASLEAETENEYWVAKESMGYRFMTETAIPKAEAYGIGSNTDVFILFGVNDLGNQPKYVSTINEKAAQWRQKGARVFFVSVNPVNEDKCSSVTNAEIEQFNAAMKSGLSYQVTYVDTYSSLYPDISQDETKTDSLGLHYTGETYQQIYNTLLAY